MKISSRNVIAHEAQHNFLNIGTKRFNFFTKRSL